MVGVEVGSGGEENDVCGERPLGGLWHRSVCFVGLAE